MVEVRKKNILVADDEVCLCDALCFDIEEAGYQTYKAYNGTDAIALMRTHEIDLIVTDVRMPGATGIDVLNEAKTRDLNLPVILLVSGFKDALPNDMYHLGAEAIFDKPFKTEKLVHRIEHCLRPTRRRWERVSIDPPSSAVTLQNFSLQLEGLTVLNIGRGGMCLNVGSGEVEIGQNIEFRISFNDGKWAPIAGTGIVRWRKKEEGSEASLVGIEFLTLTNESLATVIEVIKSLKPLAFIPSE